MGVRGLTSLISREPSLRHPFLWTSPPVVGSECDIAPDHTLHTPRKAVVVDGSSLMHSLYSWCDDTMLGGSFDDYTRVISEFFLALSSVGVQVTVVLDGVVPTEKMPTMLSREDGKVTTCEDTFSRIRLPASTASLGGVAAPVRPVMIMHAFRRALCAAGIEMIVCDYEADEVLVRMALDRKAYVMSQDSDFIIHDLPCGFIPLDSVTWSATGVSGTVVSRTDVALKFNMAPHLMPLFGCLCGNDYVDTAVLSRFHEWVQSSYPQSQRSGQKLLLSVAAFIASFGPAASVDAVLNSLRGLGAVGLERAVTEGVSRYTVCGDVDALGGGASCLLLESPTANVPGEFVREYRRGGVPQCAALLIARQEFICYGQLEDLSKTTSWASGAKLRMRLYALLLGAQCTVTEFVRRGRRTVSEKVALTAQDSSAWWPAVEALDAFTLPVNLERVRALPRKSRLALLCGVAGVDRAVVNSPQFVSASDAAVYAACTLPWVISSGASERDVWASVSRAVVGGGGADSIPGMLMKLGREGTASSVCMRGIHLAAQVQALLVVVEAINWVLGSPLGPLEPCNVFDGALFHAALIPKAGAVFASLGTPDSALLSKAVAVETSRMGSASAMSASASAAAPTVKRGSRGSGASGAGTVRGSSSGGVGRGNVGNRFGVLADDAEGHE